MEKEQLAIVPGVGEGGKQGASATKVMM